ncbi:MAG: murein L,D-transpeptidase catalytic domain-containing protein [Sphingorhabdus sp.]
MTNASALLLLATIASPAAAQLSAEPPAPLPAQPATQPAPAIVFQSGTGDGNPANVTPTYIKPPRPEVGCEELSLSAARIGQDFYPADGIAAKPKQRLDRKLFDSALMKYRNHFCAYGRAKGPAVIVVVDFAKHSSNPRLYRLDLRNGQGIDSPIRVAHGIGSDPDDDGYATVFSNVYSSYTSSLGAALGAERYVGQNGLSLRLDGLEPSNNQMRVRDIVVHSYAPERRRYFNASLVAARGKPGSSEGCFVVEPDKRDWILDTLENGGFIYSGFSGQLPQRIVPANQNVTFVRGTGSNPAAVPQPVSGTAAGTPGSPPIAPTPPAPSAPGQ